MVDYGIIALLLIQLFLGFGALFAWNSTRNECNTLKAAFLELKGQFEKAVAAVLANEETVHGFRDRVSKLETISSEAARAVQIAMDASKQAQAAHEELDDVERSLKAKISAMSRWNRPKPDEDDEEDNSPPILENNQVRPHTPLQERVLSRTFGKSAV